MLASSLHCHLGRHCKKLCCGNEGFIDEPTLRTSCENLDIGIDKADLRDQA